MSPRVTLCGKVNLPLAEQPKRKRVRNARQVVRGGPEAHVSYS